MRMKCDYTQDKLSGTNLIYLYSKKVKGESVLIIATGENTQNAI